MFDYKHLEMLADSMRLSSVLAFFSCAILVSLAQTNLPVGIPRPISLRDSIELAVTRNLDLQIQQLTLDVARYTMGATYGVYSPTFGFSGRHSFVEQPADMDPKKITLDLGYQMEQNVAGPQLSGRLPFGLNYDFRASAGEKSALTDFSDNPNGKLLFPPYGIRETNNAFAQAGVNLRQHLLRDFWIDADWLQVLLRRRDLKISEEALRFQVMRTVLAVKIGYTDLILQREQIRVQEKALQLKTQFVNETRRRVQLGDLPPLDAEQAETQLQMTLTALSAARQAYLVQQSLMKDLMTDDYRSWVGLELVPTETLVTVPEQINLSESFENAVRYRPDLAQARAAVDKSNITVRYSANQLFPSLDVIGGYGGLGVQTHLNPAISDTLHFRNPEYYYGGVISFPLDNVGERNNYRASKATRRIAELELKRAEQRVLVEVEQWANRARSLEAQIESTRKARAYAEAALVAEEKKLQNGMSTSFVVLQLQETLTSARTAEVQALADYEKAMAQFAFAEGTILDRQHLKLEVK